MAGARDLSHRIDSLKNMQKVMRAMDMIATVKLGKLLPGQGALKRFDEELKAFSLRVAEIEAEEARKDDGSSPGKALGPDAPALVILFTADKGLCGPHNNAVHKAAEALSGTLSSKGVKSEFICVGSKGAQHLKRKGLPVLKEFDSGEKVFGSDALEELSSMAIGRFKAGQAREAWIVYDAFVSTIEQDARAVRLLPFAAPLETAGDSGDEPTASAEPIHDHAPRGPAFAAEAGELLFRYSLGSALAHSRLSEQAARMTAMENASRNSRDLVARYVLARNRSRQTAITNELIEIISGTEALKG